MQVMNWGDLPFLLAVAEHGTQARAGEVLGTDATTVARRIRRLERAVGARLFEQTPAGQVPTQAGQSLLKRARAMAEIAAKADQQLDKDSALSGSVRVSVAEGFGTKFLAPRLPQFAKAHPEVSVDLVANSGLPNPPRRQTDLAVLLARPRKGPLVTRKLTDYSLGLYAAPELVEKRGEFSSIDELSEIPLVGYVPDILYAPELRYLEELALAHEPRLRSSSINAQAEIIATGGGVGILPHFMARSDPRFAPILPEIVIERSFWLVAHQETARFPQVRAMIDWLVAAVRQERAVFLPD